tara:strand:- start:36183 stop:36542 length:360 start_codon:yes stop_codon:yes gene_type:complete
MEYRSYLKEKIENYILHKNKYDNLLKELEQMRKEKNELENEIYNILNKLNLENKIFVVNNTKIKHRILSTPKVLSIKYLKLTLEEYITQNKINLNTEEIINYIQNNRIKNDKNELIIYQ